MLLHNGARVSRAQVYEMFRSSFLVFSIETVRFVDVCIFIFRESENRLNSALNTLWCVAIASEQESATATIIASKQR